MVEILLEVEDNAKVYLFAIEALIENDTDRPHVHLRGDFRRGFAHHEAFGRQVPISPGTLRGQIHAMIGVVVVRVHDFGQTEIGDFNVTAHASTSKQNVSCKIRQGVLRNKNQLASSFSNLYLA